MRNESDRNLPLLTPTEASMTDYLIVVRIFLLQQAREHANVHSITDGKRNIGNTTSVTHEPPHFVPAKAA